VYVLGDTLVSSQVTVDISDVGDVPQAGLGVDPRYLWT
jgi:hypothetical protein